MLYCYNQHSTVCLSRYHTKARGGRVQLQVAPHTMCDLHGLSVSLYTAPSREKVANAAVARLPCVSKGWPCTYVVLIPMLDSQKFVWPVIQRATFLNSKKGGNYTRIFARQYNMASFKEAIRINF